MKWRKWQTHAWNDTVHLACVSREGFSLFPLCSLSSTHSEQRWPSWHWSLKWRSTRSVTEMWLDFYLQIVNVYLYHSNPSSLLPDEDVSMIESYSQDAGVVPFCLDWTVCFTFRMNYKCLPSAHFPGTEFIWTEILCLWAEIWGSGEKDQLNVLFPLDREPWLSSTKEEFLRPYLGAGPGW